MDIPMLDAKVMLGLSVRDLVPRVRGLANIIAAKLQCSESPLSFMRASTLLSQLRAQRTD